MTALPSVENWPLLLARPQTNGFRPLVSSPAPQPGNWTDNTLNIPGLPSAHIGTDPLPVPQFGAVNHAPPSNPFPGLTNMQIGGGPSGLAGATYADPGGLKTGIDSFAPFGGGSQGVAGGVGDPQFALGSFGGTPDTGGYDGWGVQPSSSSSSPTPAQGGSGFDAGNALSAALKIGGLFNPTLSAISSLYNFGSGVFDGYNNATTVPFNQPSVAELNIPQLDGSTKPVTLDATAPVIPAPDPSLLSQIFNMSNTAGNALGGLIGGMSGDISPSQSINVPSTLVQPTPISNSDLAAASQIPLSFQSLIDAYAPSEQPNSWQQSALAQLIAADPSANPFAPQQVQPTLTQPSPIDLSSIGAMPQLPSPDPFSLTGNMLNNFMLGAGYGGAGFGYGYTGLGSAGNPFDSFGGGANGGLDLGWNGVGQPPPNYTT